MKSNRGGLWLGAGLLALGLTGRAILAWQQNSILIYGSAGTLRTLQWTARGAALAGAAILAFRLVKRLLARRKTDAGEKAGRKASLSIKNGRLNEKDIRAYLTRQLAEASPRYQPQLERYQAQLDRMNSYQDRLHLMLTENDVRDNGAAERFLDGLEQRLFASMRTAYNVITMAAPGGDSPELIQRLTDVEAGNDQLLELASRLCMTVLDRVNSQKTAVDITESIEHYISYLEEEHKV